MRNFTTHEQKFIKELIQTDISKSNILDFISNTVLFNRGIEIKEDSKQISLTYLKTDKNALSDFFEVISTINYLEKNNLIFVHSNYNSLQKGNFVSKNITQELYNNRNAEFITQPIPTNIYDLIINYKISYFYVVPELMKIFENNFKTDEQIYHEKELAESKKQTRLAQNSFYLALGALLFSFTAPFVFDTKINQNQINDIKQNLKSIEQSVKDQKTVFVIKRDSVINTLSSHKDKKNTQRLPKAIKYDG
jgi:hypothetical protein